MGFEGGRGLGYRVQCGGMGKYQIEVFNWVIIDL